MNDRRKCLLFQRTSLQVKICFTIYCVCTAQESIKNFCFRDLTKAQFSPTWEPDEKNTPA